MNEQPKCELCGEPMPLGEEMFKIHGFSGNCPKKPLSRKTQEREDDIARLTADNARLHTIIADAKRMLGEVVVLEGDLKGNMKLDGVCRSFVNDEHGYLKAVWTYPAGDALVALADKLAEAEKGTP